MASVRGVLLEVALITTAVFLALLADDWRESRQERPLADRSLELFRAEVETNKRAVEEVREYHQTLLNQVAAFLSSNSPKTLPFFASQVQFAGIQAPSFEHTALDVAIATAALGSLDPDIAYAISQTYALQTNLERLQDGFRGSLLGSTTFAAPDLTGTAVAIQAYLGDVVKEEPALLERYAELGALLDAALRGAPLDDAAPAN